MKIPFFCSYIPAALLEALGHEMADITLFTEETCGLEYSCSLHENLCSYAKYLFRKILMDSKGFDFAVVPNTCDAMKKLHATLALSGRIPSFLLDIPRRTGRESAAYLAAQYRSLLETIAPGFDPGELLARLAALPPCRPSPIGPASGGEGEKWPLGIGVVGSSYAPAPFRTTLARYGAGAVFLRHCGYGTVPSPPEGAAAALNEELLRTARNTLQHTLCPRSDRGRMTEFLLTEIQNRKLAGLIFSALKFCDFYAFEFERVRKRLPDDFPLLYLENDLSVSNDEQNRTRIEAFLEKIRSGAKGETMRRFSASLKSQGDISIGLDIGSTTTKGILMKDGREILASVILPTSINMRDGAEEAVRALLRGAEMERPDASQMVLTGYGRTAFPERRQITEITCHAIGVHFLGGVSKNRQMEQAVQKRLDARRARTEERGVCGTATVIDVGGQDSKAIRIDQTGQVLRFAMNDKCAAGTGRFLESMVKRLGITFDEFSSLSLSAPEATPISSMCSVFAESEVVSLMARGVPAANIARGLNAAVAGRVRGLVQKIRGEAPFILTGGLSLNAGFVRELETALAASISVFPESQIAGAIGAALAASGGLENHGEDR